MRLLGSSSTPLNAGHVDSIFKLHRVSLVENIFRHPGFRTIVVIGRAGWS